MKLWGNILSMFGLFHLSKDHTFRKGNTNMHKIGNSYVKMLRVGTNQATVDSMLANKEIIVRIAPHPFGLAQTYWLAHAMHCYGFLYTTLATRINSFPPPVKRLMLVDAAVSEPLVVR